MGLAGNEIIHTALQRAIESGRVHHAMLFHGPEGVGKYSAAIRFVRKLNCLDDQADDCTCSNCLRIQEPFVVHPDVMVYRKSSSRLVIHPEALYKKFTRNRAGTMSVSEFSDKLGEAITALVDSKLITSSFSTPLTHPPIALITPAPDIKLSVAQNMEDQKTNPVLSWLLSKIVHYSSEHAYHRSLKIDQIRKLQKTLSYQAYEGGYKAAIIDDADSMLAPAQNCLLKTLEEPSENSVLILISSNPSSLLPTIRSRCQAMPFKSLPELTLRQLLKDRFGMTATNAEKAGKYALGRVSRALVFDPVRFENRRSAMAAMLQRVGENSPEVDALRFVSWVFQETGSDDQRQLFDCLNDAYFFFHDLLIINSQSTIQPDQPFLNTESVCPVSVLETILTGLDEIFRISLYHPDFRLQLERLFILAFKEIAGE